MGTVPRMDAGRPRVVLVHGATGGPWTFDPWLPHLAPYDVRVPDLQEGLDVARASMADYEAAVTAATGEAGAVVVGYSMGGLVALVAARRGSLAGLVLLEASPPFELGARDPDVVPRPGTYGGEPGRSRPESAWAQAERHRGISVPAVDCPVLVVAGRDFADERGRRLAELYDGELLELPDIPHDRLATDRRVVEHVVGWIDRVTGRTARS